MWIRHQVENNGVRYIGSLPDDICHPITGKLLDMGMFAPRKLRENGEVAYWVGTDGKDEFLLYNE